MNADNKLNGDCIEPLNDHLGEFEPPSEAEVQRYRAELDRRGVTVDEECHECGELTEVGVLPEDKDVPEPAKGTMCGCCTEEHLRKKGLA